MRTFALHFVAVAVAVTASQASAQTHIYTLNGTLTDQNNASSLVAHGGALNGGGGYDFGLNQGLSLANVFNQGKYANGVYAIFIRAAFANVQNPGTNGGQSKVIDYNDRTNDKGLYVVPGLGASGDVELIASSNHQSLISNQTQNNVFAVYTVTRDVAGLMHFFINGTYLADMTFVDAAGDARFSAPGAIAQFFRDDVSPGSDDANFGSVNYISIYDHALGIEDVAVFASRIPPEIVAPEPASMVLLATGLVGVFGAVRRRSKA
ncbi:MAG: PEP-CTERM sorting domain-containing protein [bacterium]